jgi:hypothetical protein
MIPGSGSVINNIGVNHQNAEHSHLVNGLKRANRDLRQELDEKTAALEKLKRDLKLTRQHELETEV